MLVLFHFRLYLFSVSYDICIALAPRNFGLLLFVALRSAGAESVSRLASPGAGVLRAAGVAAASWATSERGNLGGELCLALLVNLKLHGILLGLGEAELIVALSTCRWQHRQS